MLALKTSGEVILLGLKTVAVNFEKKVLKRQNPQKTFFKCFILLICCQSLLICILAGVEMYLEGWTFLEGVYCWFITFTTIGFGDYVPLTLNKYLERNKEKEWIVHVTFPVFTVPYITGLCLLSSMLNLLVEYSEIIKFRFRMIYTCSVCKKQVTMVTGNENEANMSSNDEIDVNNIRLENYTSTTS